MHARQRNTLNNTEPHANGTLHRSTTEVLQPHIPIFTILVQMYLFERPAKLFSTALKAAVFFRQHYD